MKRLLFISILLVVVGLSYNCGYKLAGFSTQIPPQIKSISIPDFENKTTRYQVDQTLTFAIREEFIKRSNMVLVDRPENADSVLEGSITLFDVKPISYSNDASANLYKLTIEVTIRFIDLKNNKVIFEGEGIKFTDNYEIDDVDFLSRENQTLVKIAEEFASSVVTTILENF